MNRSYFCFFLQLLFLGLPLVASSQSFPSARATRLVVLSSVDERTVLARVLSLPLSRVWKIPVIVQDRHGFPPPPESVILDRFVNDGRRNGHDLLLERQSLDSPTAFNADGRLVGVSLVAVKRSAWYGIMAPAMTPDEVVTQIHAGLLRVLAMPEIRDQLTQLGFQVIGSSQADFARFLATTGYPLPKPVAGVEGK